MFFCVKCENFSSENTCQFCGAKKLREARENDPVFLTIQNPVYAGMLEEALKQNKIPCIKREKNGGILKFVGFGFGLEEFSFFVPLVELDRAKSILKELFEPIVFTLAKNPPYFKKGTRVKRQQE